jgi:secreted trypsin-like serine protease
VAVFGEFDISGELESRRSVTKNIRRVIVHRQYDAATFANDLALLELESPVAFDEHIVPICMPRDKEDFTGRVATVTGWGRLKYGGHDSTQLSWLNRKLSLKSTKIGILITKAF